MENKAYTTPFRLEECVETACGICESVFGFSSNNGLIEGDSDSADNGYGAYDNGSY